MQQSILKARSAGGRPERPSEQPSPREASGMAEAPAKTRRREARRACRPGRKTPTPTRSSKHFPALLGRLGQSSPLAANTGTWGARGTTRVIFRYPQPHARHWHTLPKFPGPEGGATCTPSCHFAPASWGLWRLRDLPQVFRRRRSARKSQAAAICGPFARPFAIGSSRKCLPPRRGPASNRGLRLRVLARPLRGPGALGLIEHGGWRH